jgi:LmbE family N-acetylglucosaminyl deacetylase
MSNFFVPESVLAIAAHPDDIEFSCVGTLARWARNGSRVVYVLCTSGDAGIEDVPGMTRERATQIREAEALEAAKLAGVEQVIFLHEPDGLLEATMELRKKLVREIRRFRPEVIVTSDPTVVWASDDYINHPDHRAAALAAVDAIFPAAGNPMVYPEMEKEGLQAHKPRKVYVQSWGGGGLYVNIEETIDIKIAALRAHKSQMKDWDPSDMVKTWAGETAKGKEMLYAESFKVVTITDDKAWDERHPKEVSVSAAMK